MALIGFPTDEVTALLVRLESKMGQLAPADQLNAAYYDGSRRLKQIGLAVPDDLAFLETSVNWCRTTVDSVVERMKMKSFYLPGESQASKSLDEAWDANNLGSESTLLHQSMLVYGRAYVSVSTNEEDKSQPLIQVESPTEISVEVDRRHRRITAAARFYGRGDTFGLAPYATLYLPNQTLWLERDGGSGWIVTDRDDHRLGRVPLVMFLNRRQPGVWTGESEMADVKQLVDAAARALTDLQLAVETHSVPQKYVLGMSKEDFVDKNGNPIPAWEAYFNAIWANKNPDAKVGQFTASSLENFHKTVNHYGNLAASITGIPARYFGQVSAQPPNFEGGKVEEYRLVLNTEKKTVAAGDGWGWVMGLRERFRTGEWVEGSRIKTEWFDPSMPTRAQVADAAVKLYANGTGPVSREYVWDQLGMDEGEKLREKERLEREARSEIALLEKQAGEDAVDVADEGAEQWQESPVS